MANFSNISITQAGATLIAAAVANATKIEFSHIAVGSGELQAGQDITLLTELVFHEVDLPIESMTSEGTAVIAIANLNTATVESPFLHRELGIYAGDVLVAYANAGDDYDAIPSMGGATALSKKIRVALNIAPGATSFRDIDSDEFVTYAGLQARIGAAVQERAAQAASDAVSDSIGNAAENAVREAAEEGLFKGENAYQLAVAEGYTGTLAEWLASLKGDPGPSNYQDWLNNGHEGTIDDYFVYLAEALGVDAHYVETSPHAQSGVAVSEAIIRHNREYVSPTQSGHLKLRPSHSGFEFNGNGEIFINTSTNEHPAAGTAIPVGTDTAGKVVVVSSELNSLIAKSSQLLALIN